MNNLSKIKQESEKEFKTKWAIKVRANNSKDAAKEFLLEKVWKDSFLKEIAEFWLSKLYLAYKAGFGDGEMATLPMKDVKLVSELADEIRLAERKEIVEKISAMKVIPNPISVATKSFDNGWNSALDEVMSKIKNGKENENKFILPNLWTQVSRRKG